MDVVLLLAMAVVLIVVAAFAAAKGRVTLAILTGTAGVLAGFIWLAETQGWISL